MEVYSAIGIMSGSSLDGVDLALCILKHHDSKWSYRIEKAVTYPFTEEWRIRLSELPAQSGAEIMKTNIAFGELLGSMVNKVLKTLNSKPELIASHGHTIFHEPEKGYTLQIGDGQTIANSTGLTTVSNFRQKDIDFGGQGAPLVPIGDELLFSEYDCCLNIGGIANISFSKGGSRLAYDVCAANQLLNHLSRQLGSPHDINGAFAQLGKLNKPLFNALNKDGYFQKAKPKSLSNQYVNQAFIDKLERSETSVEDKLYTVVKHIAYQVNRSITGLPPGKMLITGGGAHNRFLVKAIELETGIKIVIPEKKLVDYKEALIFALMGVLRLTDNINCLASVTGASRNSCCGDINNPNTTKKSST